MSSISPLQRKALLHYVFTFASKFLYARIMETKEYYLKYIDEYNR